MSRFHGAQGRGADRRARELRMYEAYLRQVDGNLRQGTVTGQPWAYADPAEFLSQAAGEQLARGNLDIDSYRPNPRAQQLLRRIFARRRRKAGQVCPDCRRRIHTTETEAYAAALCTSRKTGFRLRVVACPHGAGFHTTIHTRRRGAAT